LMKSVHADDEGDGRSFFSVTREGFNIAVESPDIAKLLDMIGLDELDRLQLFDAMDADGNGSLQIM